MPINTSRFAGKTAVVTGAASGIGAAIALRLIDEGAQVAGIDIAAEGLKEIASQQGGAFLAVPTDVTKESDVAEALGLSPTSGGARRKIDRDSRYIVDAGYVKLKGESCSSS